MGATGYALIGIFIKERGGQLDTKCQWIATCDSYSLQNDENRQRVEKREGEREKMEEKASLLSTRDPQEGFTSELIRRSGAQIGAR